VSKNEKKRNEKGREEERGSRRKRGE